MGATPKSWEQFQNPESINPSLVHVYSMPYNSIISVYVYSMLRNSILYIYVLFASLLYCKWILCAKYLYYLCIVYTLCYNSVIYLFSWRWWRGDCVYSTVLWLVEIYLPKCVLPDLLLVSPYQGKYIRARNLRQCIVIEPSIGNLVSWWGQKVL